MRKRKKTITLGGNHSSGMGTGAFRATLEKRVSLTIINYERRAKYLHKLMEEVGK